MNTKGSDLIGAFFISASLSLTLARFGSFPLFNSRDSFMQMTI